jgi:ribokinase
MGRVTVAGSYIVALVMDVDRLPLEGETVVGRNYHTTHGGKGSNMAACAARLGAETTFLGKIGRDGFGEDFLRLLQREGVKSHAVLCASCPDLACRQRQSPAHFALGHPALDHIFLAG